MRAMGYGGIYRWYVNISGSPRAIRYCNISSLNAPVSAQFNDEKAVGHRILLGQYDNLSGPEKALFLPVQINITLK